MRDVVEALCAVEDRGACTDAERRAALWVHDDLRRRGYEAWVETVWVRPQWAWSVVWHAVLGVAVSLASTAVPLVGLGGLLLALSFALGVPRLFYRRATQLVVVEPPEAAIKLWLVAHTDAPRCGFGFRARYRRWLRGVPPGPAVVVLLLAVAIFGGLRESGIEGGGIGAAQLVPTVLLLACVAVALDSILSDYSAGASDAAGVAVALALHEELTARAPKKLGVGLLVCGAGEAWPYGFRAWKRAEKPAAEGNVIVELGPCGSGTVAWTSRHPQLIAAAGSEGRAGTRRPTTLDRRLPSLYVRTVGPGGVPARVRSVHDTPEAVSDTTLDAVYDFVLDTVDRLDAALK